MQKKYTSNARRSLAVDAKDAMAKINSCYAYN